MTSEVMAGPRVSRAVVTRDVVTRDVVTWAVVTRAVVTPPRVGTGDLRRP